MKKQIIDSLSRILGSKIQIAGWTTYSLLLWSLKASLLVFYIRLTVRAADKYEFGTKQLTVFIGRPRANVSDPHLYRFGIGFLVASWAVVILNLYLSCRPFRRFWQINPDRGSKFHQNFI